MSNFTVGIKNPIVYNPEDRFVYEDSNPSAKLNDSYVYGERILNAKRYYETVKKNNKDDPLEISDVFYGKYEDQAKDFYGQLEQAKQSQDRAKAAAIITSKEFTALQDSVILGQNEEVLKEGILASIFEEIATPTLTGTWGVFAQDLKWHSNIPEGKSPEPSLGGFSEVSIEVPKSGGAVAITERARAIINGADVFGRLVSQLQSKRLNAENKAVAAEIESNTSNSLTGTDWGARTSGASTNNPVDVFNDIQNTFSSKVAPATHFVSKWLGYAELIQNDFVKGNHQPLQPVSGTSFGQAQQQFPIIQGIQYIADSDITSATAGWVFASQAIKLFRGPSRAYTVADPDIETEKYVTKTHFLAKTVDSSIIYRVTGITA